MSNRQIHIAIVAEGPTERQFIDGILAPYLAAKSGNAVFVSTTIVPTSRAASGAPRRGGGAWFGKGQFGYDALIRNLLSQPHWSLVTTMMDFYGFPPDFLKKHDLMGADYDQIHEALKSQ